MPGWYVHMQAAAQTMENLNAQVPPGSPLTQAQASALWTAAHDNRNYLAAGALGPDLFFLLPDFKGDVGMGLLGLAEFALKTWKELDENFITQWDTWMTPVIDANNQLANSLTGGMLGEISQVLDLLAGSLENFIAGLVAQMVDVFGLFTSGTQMGYEDSAFFWSDAFHYRKTYQFARQLYANALKADVDIMNGGTSKDAKHKDEPSRVPKQQAFALGWMSHCATDVAAHPFTNAKCGGPFRTHWQRHKVIENHIDALVYDMDHPTPGNYDSLDTAALHSRLAFGKGTGPGAPPDPRMPDDVVGPDWFPGRFAFPPYLEGEQPNDIRDRKAKFAINSEPFPKHICELLIKTMQDVYSGPNDTDGPQVLKWDPGKHVGSGGRPTVEVLQDMFQIAFEYAKFTSSSGIAVRQPMPPPLVNDHDLPRPPGPPIDGNADPSMARPMTILDIILAIIAYAIWLAEMALWIATTVATLLLELSTWPLRALIYYLLIIPAWNLFMLCRKPLILEGFISPRRSEISRGLTILGADEKGALIQLRADLDAPMGFASLVERAEPSGLNPTTLGAASQGYSLDAAYPRAMLTDLNPPWFDKAAIDSAVVPSEFVAPWRYPSHNMAGMRNGWEAPRTHVGPYIQGQDATVLMDRFAGTDSARRRFEDARTPEQTEAVSAELLAMGGQHLGDPVDYGAYLIGQLTGQWQSPSGYVSNDWQHPLPDFNLDADRGYAYQCWDYDRHEKSEPPTPVTDLDKARPDQWRSSPQIFGPLKIIGGSSPQAVADQAYSWYGYQEPCTVPQKYDAKDNPHHRSVYDPLKHMIHHYLPRAGEPPVAPACPDIDYQVTVAQMRAVGMSPTGRRPV